MAALPFAGYAAACSIRLQRNKHPRSLRLCVQHPLMRKMYMSET